MIALKTHQCHVLVKLNDIQNVVVEHVASYVYSKNLSLSPMCFLLTSDVGAKETGDTM